MDQETEPMVSDTGMSNNKPVQLPLDFQFSSQKCYENYVTGANRNVVANLRDQLHIKGGAQLYLWSSETAGCSHLLQAACNRAGDMGKTAVYLPMDLLSDQPVAILEGLEQLDLVCIDHLQAVASSGDWNEALFHLYNRLLDAGVSVVIAANRPPNALGLQLPDLQSRLAYCVIYQLTPLGDEEKQNLIAKMAAQKGLKLTEEAARYILNRTGRNLDNLISVLEVLDHCSLSEKRKLTIPFIRETMGW